MVFERQQYSKILNFVPVWIIFIFGMLALSFSLFFIEEQEHFNAVYYNYLSVIALALSAFVLILLNLDKLSQLKRLKQDKEEAIGTLENRLSALDMARDGVFIVDGEGKLSYINASLCSINDIDLKDRDSFVGKDWLGVFSTSNREAIEDDILVNLYENRNWAGSLSLYRLDHSIVYTEISLTMLPDGGMIGTIRDVSEEHRTQNEKKELEEQFYQAQKMEAIGRLAGGIAHDFNNILAAMNGYAEVLMDDLPEDTQQHAFAKNILHAGLQARDLIDHMLSFSRRSDNICEALDLVVSVSDAMSMLKATLPKTIELREDVSVLYAPIYGNATQISQLIMNLCVNAQDALEEEYGCIDIEINQISAEDVGLDDSLQDALADVKEAPSFRIDDIAAGRARLVLGNLCRLKQYVKMSVRDTGTGISHTVMDHIFEPFFTTKSVEKGTGLGLATVLGIVVSHQGFLVIDSTLGIGTCFDLYFPLIDDIQESVEQKPDQHNAIEKESKKVRHILLVEDHDDVRGLMLEWLNRLGHKTSFAVSGMAGLDMVRENSDLYDLVITDYSMPKMTGLEMVQQIHLDLPNLPFIVLSGYKEGEIKELIEDHPAIKCILHKPVSRDDLAKSIQDVLSIA